MARNPVTVALPPFSGVTRRIILTLVAVFFLVLVLSLAPTLAALVVDQSMLHPDKALGLEVWQFITYPFINTGLLSMLLACLSLWFFAAALEDERGGLWLGEFFFSSTVGGGLLACVLSRTVLARVPELGPGSRASGAWGAVLAILLAYAWFHPDEELRFNFLFRVKAKYLAAIYLLVYLAMTLTGGGRFDALVVVCAAAAGFVYLRFAPRRGLRFAASEGWFGWQNSYFRWKRRRAAKKFTVYMKKQGKDVSLDASGRYVSLDEERDRRARRDPNDRSWMN